MGDSRVRLQTEATRVGEEECEEERESQRQQERERTSGSRTKATSVYRKRYTPGYI